MKCKSCNLTCPFILPVLNVLSKTICELFLYSCELFFDNLVYAKGNCDTKIILFQQINLYVPDINVIVVHCMHSMFCLLKTRHEFISILG